MQCFSHIYIHKTNLGLLLIKMYVDFNSVYLGWHLRVRSSNKLPSDANTNSSELWTLLWIGSKEHVAWIQVSWINCLIYHFCLLCNFQKSHAIWETHVLSSTFNLGCCELSHESRSSLYVCMLFVFLSLTGKFAVVKPPMLHISPFGKMSQSQKWQH